MEGPALAGVKRAAQRREHADELQREATRELRNYCLLARAEGVPDEEIAEAAAISHRELHRLLADRAAP
jgi:hypothetical protein